MTYETVTDAIEMLVNNMDHSGTILIANDKVNIYKKCFGYADLEKKIPVSFDTQFLAGSVTKQFAAAAILKSLHDKFNGNIKSILNKTIENFLGPEHEIWDGAMPSWATKVTIDQLLNHSSGIPNYTSLSDFMNQRFEHRVDLVNFFKTHELDFKPGEKFSYSNSNYYLLGIILETITAQSLDDYLHQQFFKPLNMQSTFFPMQGTVDELIKNDPRFKSLARGYAYEITTPRAKLAEIKRYERMEIPGAAGSLITTAEDLLKWNVALHNNKILPQHLLDLMLHPYFVTEREDSYYGYGIEVTNLKSLGTYYTHRGGIPGFRSILTYIPALKLSIITLQNVVADPEKIMPEVTALEESFPPNTSREEIIKKLTDIIETKYPGIIENRKRFEFGPIYDEIIKALDK